MARSVDGTARNQVKLDQVALADSGLDLSAAAVGPVLITSDRQARIVADSRMDQAQLRADLTNVGVAGSRIQAGSSTSTYRIAARDHLELGLQALRGGQLQLSDQVVALDGGHLEDSGGDDDLAINAEVGVRISAAVAEGFLSTIVSLAATALRNSIIRLGSGDNQVSITSQVAPEIAIQPEPERRLSRTGAVGTPMDGAIADTGRVNPGEMTREEVKDAEADGSEANIADASDGALDRAEWQLEARSYGIRNSLVDTGDGNDDVVIAASISPGGRNPASDASSGQNGRDPHAVALEDSELNLGAGDDSLKVEGALLRSRLDAGLGEKLIQINGAVVDGELFLHAGSSSHVQLGSHGNSFQIQGAGELRLDSGSGDDHFVVDGNLGGSLSAGGGVDLLEARPDPSDSTIVENVDTPGVSAGPAGSARSSTAAAAAEQGALATTLVLEGPGEGVVGRLAFSGVESVDLKTRAGVVRIAPSGSLKQRLSAQARGGVLDYGGWNDRVRVDLGEGRATAIAAGEGGGVEGFVAVQGGTADDHLVAGHATRWLHGGAGEDWLELSRWLPSAGYPDSPGSALRGDGGRDLFVLPGLEGPWPALALTAARQPSLVDLTLVEAPGGGLGLSDRLAYWQRPALTSAESGGWPGEVAATLLEPNPSGAEGVGDIRRLPIAPLEQLLAGIGTTTPQLAIAAGAGGSELVLLGPGRTSLGLAALPSLRLPEQAAGAAPSRA